MKNILFAILLALPSLALSQENNPTQLVGKTVYPLSGEELDRIYQRDMENQFCADDLVSCKEIAHSLGDVITNLKKEIDKGISELKELKDERDKVQKEKEDLLVEKAKLEAKTDKRIGIGVHAGYGIDGKAYLGVGISYDIFRL